MGEESLINLFYRAAGREGKISCKIILISQENIPEKIIFEIILSEFSGSISKFKNIFPLKIKKNGEICLKYDTINFSNNRLFNSRDLFVSRVFETHRWTFPIIIKIFYPRILSSSIIPRVRSFGISAPVPLVIFVIRRVYGRGITRISTGAILLNGCNRNFIA